MKVTLLLIPIICLLAAGSRTSDKYLCFSDPEHPTEKLCYPLSKSSEHESAARNAVRKLSENIDNPGSLVEMEGDMAERYTANEFQDSFKKHFSNLNRSSVAYVLTHGRYSAILLKDKATLFYDHERHAFIFNYDSPLFFEGLTSYYGKGFEPYETDIEIEREPLNCNLYRDGIVFISEPKDNFFYTEDGTFCEYSGFYFADEDKGNRIRRIDQIGKSYSVIHRVRFAEFLEWLGEHP